MRFTPSAGRVPVSGGRPPSGWRARGARRAGARARRAAWWSRRTRASRAEPAAVRRQDRPPLRDTHLDTLLKPYRVQADLLVTMPGVSQIVAQVLIAEIGVESM